MPAVNSTRSLAERLAARRGEIERAVMTRVCALADPAEVGDPQYEEGLREAVVIALNHGIEAIERDSPEPPPVPIPLLAQARHAARSRVGLDVVLRRYLGGYVLLDEFMMREAASQEQFSLEDLHCCSRFLVRSLDHLVTAVTDEYKREEQDRQRATGRGRYKRVKALLAGELIEQSGLDYSLEDRWHLGVVAVGSAKEALQLLASKERRQLLLVHPGRGSTWGWLGGYEPISPEELSPITSRSWPEDLTLSFGEPGFGMAGWRQTHRQALAALPVGTHSTQPVVRYSDVALLAGALHEPTLSSSLVELYLTPLEQCHDNGATLRQTLLAYFSTARNLSSAAAILGVNRKTVSLRLREAEKRLGKPIDDCAPELEIALRLNDLVPTLGLTLPHIGGQ